MDKYTYKGEFNLKLDFDIVREFLIEVEKNANFDNNISLSRHETEDIKLYAAKQLIDAGFLEGRVRQFKGGYVIINIVGLTYAGHELLDNIRSDTNYKEVKNIVSKLGSVSLSIFSSVAAEIIKNKIGL